MALDLCLGLRVGVFCCGQTASRFLNINAAINHFDPSGIRPFGDGAFMYAQQAGKFAFRYVHFIVGVNDQSNYSRIKDLPGCSARPVKSCRISRKVAELPQQLPMHGNFTLEEPGGAKSPL